MPILQLKDKDKNGQLINAGRIEIKNQTEQSAEIYFYGDINNASWLTEYYPDDKSPKDVSDFLNQLEGTEKLDIFINSGGGSVFGGIAIYNQLKRYSGEKTVHIDGIAASIASVIACAGDKVIVSNSSTFMVHKPMCYAGGNADDLRKVIESLDLCQGNIMNIYMSKVKEGISRETIESLVNKETWLSSEEVCNYFNFSIEDGVDIAACSSIYFDKYKNTPNLLKSNNETKEEFDYDKIANLVVSKLTNKNNNEKNNILDDLDLI